MLEPAAPRPRRHVVTRRSALPPAGPPRIDQRFFAAAARPLRLLAIAGLALLAAFPAADLLAVLWSLLP